LKEFNTAEEIKMEFNKDELWCLREVLRCFIGDQVRDGGTYMTNEALDLATRINKTCGFKV
jgi:hypothetical protein